MSLEIKTAHQGPFKEIFNLIAKKDGTGKMDRAKLAELFQTIDYKLTEEQFNEMANTLFQKKDQVQFDDFLKIFNLKLTEYSVVDVRNAFRLIAKDDDKYIPMEKIKKILEKQGMSEVEILFLTRQLEPYSEGGKINYGDFLKNLSI